MVELEEYILTIDKDRLDQLHEEVRKYDGKCFIAINDDKAVGLIMGTIPPYDENDYLDYKCPKRGEITELVVSKKIRSNGIGQQLMNKMEDYFKSV